MYAQVEDQPGSGQAFSQDCEGMEILFRRPPPQSRPQASQDQAPAALGRIVARAQERYGTYRSADAEPQVTRARTNTWHESNAASLQVRATRKFSRRRRVTTTPVARYSALRSRPSSRRASTRTAAAGSRSAISARCGSSESTPPRVSST